MNDRTDIIAVDIGNSRLKLLSGNVFRAFYYSSDWLSGLREFFVDFSGKIHTIAFASVNNERLSQFKKVAEEFQNIELFDIADKLQKQNKIKYKHISGIGIDRILGLLGAMEEKQAPLLTVDCGTAITINAVNDKRECIGGAIFAGIYTQLDALVKSTGNLKNTQIFAEDKPVGSTTEESLRIGIINGASGSIKEIVRNICLKYFPNEKVPVFLTGGYSSMFVPLLSDMGNDLFHRDKLVLQGIMSLI